MRIYYTSPSGERFMTHIPIIVRDGGIQCIRFERRYSDGQERAFIFEEAATAAPSPS